MLGLLPVSQWSLAGLLVVRHPGHCGGGGRACRGRHGRRGAR